MKYWLPALALALAALSLPAPARQAVENPHKAAVIASVDAQADELTALSDEIWRYAEIAFRATRSSATLVQHAREHGFRVTTGVAGIPTAFIAEYGSGSPVIAIMGEFDALPGLSQQTVPVRSPIEEGAPGHGCGHNVFGAASLGAAIAVRELIEQGELGAPSATTARRRRRSFSASCG